MWARMGDNCGPRLPGENHQFSAFLSVCTRFQLKNAVKHIKITWKAIVLFVHEIVGTNTMKTLIYPENYCFPCYFYVFNRVF